jgi:dolichol-phosphate mannosyltransferase
LKAAPDADVLIVDDNSQDGTAEVGARMAHRLEAVHILHRPERRGVGSAYLEGFNWALNRGYPVVVQIAPGLP